MDVRWNRFKMRLGERRTRIVLCAAGIAYLLTAGATWYYFEKIAAAKSEIEIAFYASWVQDIVFFSIVGIAVMIYTAPFSADSATFDERVIAFYGTSAPAALRDYAKHELRRFGGFATEGRRTWEIREYRKDIDAFRIEVEIKYEIKNLLDVEYLDKGNVEIRPDEFEKPPNLLGEVQIIAINGASKLQAGPEPIPKGGYSKPIETSIGPYGTGSYLAKYWIWGKRGEECGFTPRRVTENFTMEVFNVMNDCAVKLMIGDHGDDEIILQPGTMEALSPVSGATPRTRIFVMTLDLYEETT
ncbi:MAG TPA: hypothetical protein VGC25_04620 [Alphaproteobacteria bacterium]